MKTPLGVDNVWVEMVTISVAMDVIKLITKLTNTVSKMYLFQKCQ